MADNVTTQSTAPATPAAGTVLAARSATYSGDASALIAPVGLVAFAGSDDSKTVFDLNAESGYHVVAAASTNVASVKASPGLLRGVRVFNLAAYPIYVKFHNTAGTPTAGSGVVLTVGVQAGVTVNLPPISRYFSTGIGISIVKDLADAGTTAVASADCVVDVDYV